MIDLEKSKQILAALGYTYQPDIQTEEGLLTYRKCVRGVDNFLFIPPTQELANEHEDSFRGYLLYAIHQNPQPALELLLQREVICDLTFDTAADNPNIYAAYVGDMYFASIALKEGIWRVSDRWGRLIQADDLEHAKEIVRKEYGHFVKQLTSSHGTQKENNNE